MKSGYSISIDLRLDTHYKQWIINMIILNYGAIKSKDIFTKTVYQGEDLKEFKEKLLRIVEEWMRE